MMKKDYSGIIAGELSLKPWQVENTIKLLDDGASIPFIARYRKEMTGSLDETQIVAVRERLQQLRDLDKRREAILKSIDAQGKLSPELEASIREAQRMTELEDLYLPYKPKRKTRASIAREKGLEGLAKLLLQQDYIQLEKEAAVYVDEKKGVNTADDALAGARDIIAEWVSENKIIRERIRNLFERNAVIRTKVAKDKEAEGQKYRTYFSIEEKLMKSPSHRILAILRGEKEGFLKVSIAPSEDDAMEIIYRKFVKADNDAAFQVKLAADDAYKRLLQPSMESELRHLAKEQADEKAIYVFAENLRQLLLAPPLAGKNVMAIDPGFRTGCKIVCLNKQGHLLHNETIYPHPPQRETSPSMRKVLSLADAYKIDAIAIGNGTAGRETENFIRKIRFDKDIIAVMVNESGASVYSASRVAREEFPEYDVTVRGAVSIGRRLLDPLAELVKIDPKSIGVGQYQHDVNQNLLKQSLDDVVISCVNAVGVEVNTASSELLKYVSGVGPGLAQNIIEYRNIHGAFKSRNEFKQVSRFGDKAFEQAAGFLRIKDSENPLDRSAVHPESYHVVESMARKLNARVDDLIKNGNLRDKIMLQAFVTEKTGMPTLKDIMDELAKPGRDPRKKFDFFEFDKSVNNIEDVKIGMILPGIVTNITAFGAFVDIGVHQDGLVHISQIADKFIHDPNEVLRLNQKVKVKVMSVEIDRKRIQLSIKEAVE